MNDQDLKQRYEQVRKDMKDLQQHLEAKGSDAMDKFREARGEFDRKVAEAEQIMSDSELGAGVSKTTTAVQDEFEKVVDDLRTTYERLASQFR